MCFQYNNPYFLSTLSSSFLQRLLNTSDNDDEDNQFEYESEGGWGADLVMIDTEEQEDLQ